ncbi:MULTISPECIES: hypothetical protein [Tatumella]|uniref:Uncharacterized protein n=1 Tax=Tatumella punctata TaxID=399969 RepID=A0ABW1VP90_9GAMM|nr:MULTISPECIES: hypothetical protein [unclassified Tatumella]MBS0857208.1 hypothetical protein [Tatumella sp. JGM16]MBS0878900.1 hypothetical protein [Tatumella sp. JGM82]MBS0892357.1 hypothetical protein [Tatumella sp. JGM94]MBS0895487.1 hypothetical protein [Tatumella sp. JGM130]MBS0903446.1 hypothetical protein [Tatumella sp. JGM100]
MTKTIDSGVAKIYPLILQVNGELPPGMPGLILIPARGQWRHFVLNIDG